MEEVFRYKGAVIKPSPLPMGGEYQGQWDGRFALEIHTGPEVQFKLCSVPGTFPSKAEAIAAIISHARHTIDREIGSEET